MDTNTAYRAATRLYTDHNLLSQAIIDMTPDQQHYLYKVLRLTSGDKICVFNGRDGEWIGECDGKKSVRLIEKTRDQTKEGDIWMLFAPVKKDNTDFILQKSTELGVATLWPIYTERSNTHRFNMERAIANVTEATEQSRRLTIPQIMPDMNLQDALSKWDHDRLLIYGDELQNAPALAAILPSLANAKIAFLIGPEGGFSADEHRRLCAYPFVRPMHLGSRILRAETAVIATLACYQSICGDWKN
jgi:16S rRNA (uracil1498-N3)-methyltransferase